MLTTSDDQGTENPGRNFLTLEMRRHGDEEPTLHAVHNGDEIPLISAVGLIAGLLETIREEAGEDGPPIERIDEIAGLFYIMAVIESYLTRDDDNSPRRAGKGRDRE